MRHRGVVVHALVEYGDGRSATQYFDMLCDDLLHPVDEEVF
jgi:hypothetical protein